MRSVSMQDVLGLCYFLIQIYFYCLLQKHLFSKLQQFSAQLDLFYLAKDKLQVVLNFLYSSLNIV